MKIMFKLIYEIKEKKLKIFDSSFYNYNKRKCKMIINNKLSSIKKYIKSTKKKICAI